MHLEQVEKSGIELNLAKAQKLLRINNIIYFTLRPLRLGERLQYLIPGLSET
jgi:hypothetical protein